MLFARFLIAFTLFLLINVTICGGVEKQSRQKRRSKELEDRISELDEGTKKRIGAMKAAGMPKEAIAEKIAYEAGGKGTAKRIVDALVDEPVKLKSKPKIINKNTNTNSNKKTSNINNAKKAQQKKASQKSPNSQQKKNSNNRKTSQQGFRSEL